MRGPKPVPIAAVKPGCFVKKCFKASRVRKGPHKGTRVSRECIWIKVTKVTSTGYEGKLANAPIAVPMRFGQKVRVKRSEVTAATCEKARALLGACR
jgi:hypothetical protein